jgi:hypothetical protein
MSTETGPVVMCAIHPRVAAYTNCQICGNPICADCTIIDGEGTPLCRSCESGEIPLADDPGFAPAVAPAPAAHLAVACQQHRRIYAIACCHGCGATICGTCAFSFDRILLCPGCATRGEQSLDGTRRTMAWWSVGLAAWNVVPMVLLLTGALDGMMTNEFVAGAVLERLSLGPAFIGLGLAIGAMRGWSGHWTLWTGLIANAVWLFVWALLILIGLMEM